MARNKYPEETVKKILDVSLKLFMEKGYENTTILDIVDNLGGLTRGAFYHHFKSKEEVLDALGEKLFYDNTPLEEIKNDKSLNGLQKIKKLMASQYESSEAMTINVYSMSLMKSPRFLAKHIKEDQKISANIFQLFIEEGISDGSIQDNNPKLLSEFIVLLANIWCVPTIYPCTRQELSEKIIFIKNVLDNMGYPIFDDEFLKLGETIFDKLNID